MGGAESNAFEKNKYQINFKKSSFQPRKILDTEKIPLRVFSYMMIKYLPLDSYLTLIEQFSFFFGCLCHDLDHSGTTNPFQVLMKTTLNQLYGVVSVLEIHHFAYMIVLLNSVDCNIFHFLELKEYDMTLKFLYAILLATDIAVHMKIRKDIEVLADHGFEYKSDDNRRVLTNLLITACNLSDQTKTWTASKQIAIYSEFFNQGDVEYKQSRVAILMMDRNKACLPKLQIDFLDVIGLPCYRLLLNIFPEIEQIYATTYHSRRCWIQLHKYLDDDNQPPHSKCSMEALLNNEIAEIVSTRANYVRLISKRTSLTK